MATSVKDLRGLVTDRVVIGGERGQNHTVALRIEDPERLPREIWIYAERRDGVLGDWKEARRSDVIGGILRQTNGRWLDDYEFYRQVLADGTRIPYDERDHRTFIEIERAHLSASQGHRATEANDSPPE